MDYLVTTAYCAREFMGHPNYVLISATDKLANQVSRLAEVTEDTGVLGVREFASYPALWVEEITGSPERDEELGDSKDVISLEEWQEEELDPKDVEMQTVRTRRAVLDSDDTEAYFTGRLGDIRVESRRFTLSDLKAAA
jgi:hypothetical protein